ncbi:hypothetical protein ACRCUN_17070 [Mycobacterium sp. LTG2003]
MRFNPLPLVVGHWRGLSNIDRDGAYVGGDAVTRTILVVGSAGVGAAVWHWQVSFSAPTAILSGFSLLSGVLLSVFAQLASMRVRLTDSPDESVRRRVLKDSLDESVSHVLLAALLGLVASTVIVISMAVTDPIPPAQPEIAGVWAIILAVVGVYEMLLLVMLIPRLYSAYTRVNDVSPEIDGHGAGKLKGHAAALPGQPQP